MTSCLSEKNKSLNFSVLTLSDNCYSALGQFASPHEMRAFLFNTTFCGITPIPWKQWQWKYLHHGKCQALWTRVLFCWQLVVITCHSTPFQPANIVTMSWLSSSPETSLLYVKTSNTNFMLLDHNSMPSPFLHVIAKVNPQHACLLKSTSLSSCLLSISSIFELFDLSSKPFCDNNLYFCLIALTEMPAVT